MKKYLVILMAVAMLFAMTSLAFAAQDPGGAKGNITANEYTFGADWNDGNGNTMAIGAKDWSYKEQGTAVTSGSYTGAQGFASSTHVYGTWNSPYTYGIDGYNYNDAQDYTDTGAQVGVGQHVYYPANGAFITLSQTWVCRWLPYLPASYMRVRRALRQRSPRPLPRARMAATSPAPTGAVSATQSTVQPVSLSC